MLTVMNKKIQLLTVYGSKNENVLVNEEAIII